MFLFLISQLILFSAAKCRFSHNASYGSSHLGGFYSYMMCNTECGFSNYNLLFEAIMQVIVSDV